MSGKNLGGGVGMAVVELKKKRTPGDGAHPPSQKVKTDFRQGCVATFGFQQEDQQKPFSN